MLLYVIVTTAVNCNQGRIARILMTTFLPIYMSCNSQHTNAVMFCGYNQQGVDHRRRGVLCSDK